MVKRSLLWRSLLSPAGVTLLAGLLVLAVVLARASWDPNELVRIGTRFSEGLPNGTEGYDGQFFYYIARQLDPEQVAPLLDVPAYRYQRILLPLLARLLSGGDAGLLLWALPLASLMAHVAGVHLLSELFKRWKASRWFALGYGLGLGGLLAIRLALPETLAFALVIAAVWCQACQRTWQAWLLLSLAVFAKETALLFVAAQGVSALFARRWRDAAGLALVVGLPLLLFRLWLFGQFGSFGFGLGGQYATGFEWIPFQGWWRIGEHDPTWRLLTAALYTPLVFLPVGWGVWAAVRVWLGQRSDFTALAVLANAAIFPFLPLSMYVEPYGMARLALGLHLALLLFAARHGVRRVLAYGVLFALLSLWLFAA